MAETKGNRGGKREGARRPLLTDEKMKEYRITLPPSVADYIRSLDDGGRSDLKGNLSGGIRKLAELHQALELGASPDASSTISTI